MKNHNAQYALLRMIENWKTQSNQRKKIGVIITDLSKAFDTLNHNLLIAKLQAYGLDLNATSFIKSCVTNRYQRCKVGHSFSKWGRIIAGVPQGSILGSLLFSIFINDIFLYIENSDLCDYPDDSTLYASGESLSITIESLKADFLRISKWLHENFMVLNPDKCHFMVLGDSNCTCNLTCNGATIERSKEENVLGRTIGHKLTFTSHLRNMIKNANQKLHALSRVKCYMGFEQNELIMSSFIKSQFSYCPLIWMLCSRTSMNKLNNIHEKMYRIFFLGSGRKSKSSSTLAVKKHSKL